MDPVNRALEPLDFINQDRAKAFASVKRIDIDVLNLPQLIKTTVSNCRILIFYQNNPFGAVDLIIV